MKFPAAPEGCNLEIGTQNMITNYPINIHIARYVEPQQRGALEEHCGYVLVFIICSYG